MGRFDSIAKRVGSCWTDDPSGVFLIVLAILHLVSLWNRRRNDTCRSKTPTGTWPVVPGSKAFFGNWLAIGSQKHFTRKVEEWAKKHGDDSGLVECNIFGTRYLIVSNNEMALKVLSLRPNKVVKNHRVVSASKSVGADGIFAAEGPTWRRDRRLVSPALNMHNTQSFVPVLQAMSSRLVNKWKDDSRNNNGAVVINRDLSCFSVDCIGQFAFGEDYDSLRRPVSQEAQDVECMFNGIRGRSLSPIPFWKIPFIGDYLDGIAPVKHRFKAKISRHLKDEEARQEVSASDGATFLSKIVALNRLGKETMPLDRIHGNLQTLLIAGADTTSSTMMVCLWKIARDTTDLQKELAEEAMTLPCLTSNSDVNKHDLMEGLPRLRSLFYEVVRAEGPAPQLMCQAAAAVPVNEATVLPVGTKFIVPSQYLGTLPGSGIPVGPSGIPSSGFCPRRWLTTSPGGKVDGVTKPSKKIGVHLSTGFGSTPRICPGQYVAELEVILTLAAILQSFKISISRNHPPMKMVTNMTAGPDIDIELILEPR